MNILVVVFAELLLFLRAPAPQRFLHVAIGVLATDHESNLAGRVGGYGSISILGNRKHFLAVLLELGDQRKVQPLVFS